MAHNKKCRVRTIIPDAVQHFFQTHPHCPSRHGVHQEEPSKIHQQILNPFVYYSAKCHLQDKGKQVAARMGNNEIVYPMFQLLVLLYSYGKYTNVIKLNCVKDSIFVTSGMIGKDVIEEKEKESVACQRWLVIIEMVNQENVQDKNQQGEFS